MADEKDIEALIDDLSGELKPVELLAHPFLRVTPWIIIAFAYLAGVIHFLGLRMDLGDKLHEAPFVFELGLAGFIAVTGAYCAGWLSIPDSRGQKWLVIIPSTMFAVFMFWIACKTASEGFLLPEMHWHHCFSDALLMGFVPIATLSMLVRRGATTNPGWLAFMSILSVGALGWLALRITCGDDSAGHTMIFHFLPFVLFAAMLGALARRLYRW